MYGVPAMTRVDTQQSVYLSYASQERANAQKVRVALKQRGINVLMDVDFEPGEPVLINIGHAINSGVFLPLISTAYLDRPFTQDEVSAAAMTGENSRVLPGLVEKPPAPTTAKGRDLGKVLN